MHAEIEKRLKESEALSTRAIKKLSENKIIIQEQANLIKEKEKESSTDAPSAKDKAILAAAEKNEKKERAYAEMDKKLDDTEALSTKDKEILAVAEKLAKKEYPHAEIEKRLKESEALSTRAIKKLNEKQRIIQEQANLIKEN